MNRELERKASNSRPPTRSDILLTDTSRWALAARLAIAFTKAGASVSAVCPTPGHPLAKTRLVSRIFHYSGIRPLESLANAIVKTNPQFVIPCDDRGVQYLHELYANARGMGAAGRAITALVERSLGSPASYAIVSSRYDLLRIAEEEGIRVPEMSEVRTTDDLDSWHTRQRLPYVLKADGTWGGRGVKIVQAQSQAKEFFGELTQLFGIARVLKRCFVNRDAFWLRPWWKDSKPAVIAQSHIQGRPANCSVACYQGKVVGAIAVEVVSAQGATGPASVVRVVENPEMIRAGERIAHRLGLSGFFGLDFMIEQGGGDLYLIEMNPRCTPPCHLNLGKNRDLVGSLWSQMSGEPYSESPAVTQKELIAYFPQAWTINSEFLQSSFQDIPQEVPDLVEELRRPWPDRSMLFRASNYFHRMITASSALTSKS